MHAEAKRKHPKGEVQEGTSEEARSAVKRTRAWRVSSMRHFCPLPASDFLCLSVEYRRVHSFDSKKTFLGREQNYLIDDTL